MIPILELAINVESDLQMCNKQMIAPIFLCKNSLMVSFSNKTCHFFCKMSWFICFRFPDKTLTMKPENYFQRTLVC